VSFFLFLIVATSLTQSYLLIENENLDLTTFVIPWFRKLFSSGFSAVSGEFSNYNPPYLYLLWVVTPLHPLLSEITIIKLVSIFFNFIGGVVAAAIVWETTRDRNRSLIAGACFLIIPTVTLNSAYWGQCDVIYSTFALTSVLYTLKNKPSVAVSFFAISLSFKLQAILIAPYFMYLIVKRSVSIRHLLLFPIVYFICLLPAWLMGRPASKLLQIYLIQASSYDELSLNAPNLYNLVQEFDLISYHSGVVIGLILATITAVFFVLWSQKIACDARGKLLIVTTSAIVMPFALPKMHERYFFMADVLSYTLAFAIPKTWPLAIAVQMASLAAYLEVLFELPYGVDFGALVATIAVFTLAINDADYLKPLHLHTYDKPVLRVRFRFLNWLR
jgi:Gpi18-like mannosyltransferase